MERGRQNGVQRLHIVQQKEMREMEPNLNPNAVAALHAPDAGSLIPYEYAIALAENAADNGVEVRIRREVTAITPSELGFDLRVRYWEPAAYVSQSKFPLMALGIAAVPVLLALVFSALQSNLVASSIVTGIALVVGHVLFSLLRGGKGSGKT